LHEIVTFLSLNLFLYLSLCLIPQFNHLPFIDGGLQLIVFSSFFLHSAAILEFSVSF
jgi:hypothetical protein